MTELFAPVCSITRTKRRRFFWAAWWSAPPRRVPFQKPDATGGGEETWEAAHAAAERAAGTTLGQVEPAWARAVNRVLRGEPPFADGAGPGAPKRAPRAKPEPSAPSIWSILGVAESATDAELKAAFRQRALEAHPDQGGTPAAFQALLRAYDEAKKRARRPKPKR